MHAVEREKLYKFKEPLLLGTYMTKERKDLEILSRCRWRGVEALCTDLMTKAYLRYVKAGTIYYYKTSEKVTKKQLRTDAETFGSSNARLAIFIFIPHNLKLKKN